MKNILLPLFLIAFSLGACKTLQVRDFHSRQSIPQRLPDLGLLIHERSFLAAFDEEYFRTMISPDNDIWFGYQVTDQALNDVFRLLDNDLHENILRNEGGQFGHARFKLVYYQRPWKGAGWIVPSIGTLFIANLFGMPFAVANVQLELQMEITDADGAVLVRYIAPGAGKSPQAFYYGYTASDAIRRANLIALQDAMAHIKDKLEADVPMLTAKLEASGTLKKDEK